MVTVGSMPASMSMMLQPSAPNAVAIISRGWNCLTAQRRTSCGPAADNSRLAVAISASDNRGSVVVMGSGLRR